MRVTNHCQIVGQGTNSAAAVALAAPTRHGHHHLQPQGLC